MSDRHQELLNSNFDEQQNIIDNIEELTYLGGCLIDTGNEKLGYRLVSISDKVRKSVNRLRDNEHERVSLSLSEADRNAANMAKAMIDALGEKE